MPEQHFTEPPPRYSEASLVRKLEELGIGRPSTYASILSTLRDRAYVRMDRGRFIPEDKGRLVTAFLTSFFKRYVEYGFTADLEEKLDEVSAGELDWKQLLRDFWRDFSAAVGETKDLKITDVINELDEILSPHIFPVTEEGVDPRKCPLCGEGRLNLKLGRFGAFVGCTNYPNCRFTRQLAQSNGEAGGGQPVELGHDPATGRDDHSAHRPLRSLFPARRGREAETREPAKGTDPSNADLELGIKMLSLPREVGKHPETGEPITANFGRFGPYVQHQKQYASLESPEDVFTIGINHAVTLIAERKAKGFKRRGPEPLKELGPDPASGEIIKVMKGRYGTYVTDGTTNATIPGDGDADSVTLADASALIAARVAKGGGKKKKKAAKPAAKAAAKPKKQSKSETDKKPAKKKATKRKHPNPRSKPPKKGVRDTAPVLDKARVLEALAAQPGAGKRDIGRMLGVKGSDRITLKRILRELADEGAVSGSRKRGYIQPGALPDVAVLEITGQDMDGELIARPQRWESDEEPPKIIVVPGRDAEAGPALGSGERVLARLSLAEDGYEARVIKRLGASAHRVLGVVHVGPNGVRIAPIDRKSRTEFTVEARDRAGAANNELVLAEPIAGRAAGLPRARVVERLGSMDAPKAVSLIAIHAHGIPTDFPKEAIDEAEGALPCDPHGRTDLRKLALVTIDPPDARDHDDAVWAEVDTDPANPGGHIVIVAIADVAHYVRSGSPLDREAYKRGNSVYFPDRVVPMLPERLSADLCSLMEGVDRPCLAVRMVFDRHGRKKRHEFLRAMMRSAASLTYAQAQDAFDGRADEDCPRRRKTRSTDYGRPTNL